MTPEKRINEFTKRQVFYDSSMIAKLNAVDGKWSYKVYSWINDTKRFCKLDSTSVDKIFVSTIGSFEPIKNTEGSNVIN